MLSSNFYPRKKGIFTQFFKLFISSSEFIRNYCLKTVEIKFCMFLWNSQQSKKLCLARLKKLLQGYYPLEIRQTIFCKSWTIWTWRKLTNHKMIKLRIFQLFYYPFEFWFNCYDTVTISVTTFIPLLRCCCQQETASLPKNTHLLIDWQSDSFSLKSEVRSQKILRVEHKTNILFPIFCKKYANFIPQTP